MKEFIMNEICNFIANTNNEGYQDLSSEEIDELAEDVVDDIMLDDELNRVLNDTIEWYVNKELVDREDNSEEHNDDKEISLF